MHHFRRTVGDVQGRCSYFACGNSNTYEHLYITGARGKFYDAKGAKKKKGQGHSEKFSTLWKKTAGGIDISNFAVVSLVFEPPGGIGRSDPALPRGVRRTRGCLSAAIEADDKAMLG